MHACVYVKIPVSLLQLLAIQRLQWKSVIEVQHGWKSAMGHIVEERSGNEVPIKLKSLTIVGFHKFYCDSSAHAHYNRLTTR